MAQPGIARNAAVSALNVVVTGLVLFVLYRFLLRTIGIAELGVWSIVLATTSIGRISQLGIAASVVRLVSREVARGAQPAVVEVVHTAAIAMGALAGVAVLALYPAARWVLGLVVSPDLLEPALVILPWAATSLWLASVCSVLESGLDGFQRVDLRALATMASMVVYLVLAVLLVPRHGLVGLAAAQLAQTGFLAGAALSLLAAQLGAARLVSLPRPSARRLKEMLGYGVHVQAMTLGLLLLEPVAKGLLSKLAGLELVGWFEMANRMVMQIRALLTAGGEALVPAVAHASQADPAAVPRVYQEAYRAVLFLVLPTLALTALGTPAICEVWIGGYQPAFVGFSYLLEIGMFLSLLAVPAYFTNLGLGTLRWNTIGVAVILGLTVLLALLASPWLGPWGVVGGYSLAMLAGHAVILASYHARQAIPWRSLVPRDCLSVSIAAAATAAAGLIVYYALRARLGLTAVTALMLLVAAVGLAPPVWHHPLRRRLTAWLGPAS